MFRSNRTDFLLLCCCCWATSISASYHVVPLPPTLSFLWASPSRFCYQYWLVLITSAAFLLLRKLLFFCSFTHAVVLSVLHLMFFPSGANRFPHLLLVSFRLFKLPPTDWSQIQSCRLPPLSPVLLLLQCWKQLGKQRQIHSLMSCLYCTTIVSCLSVADWSVL